MVERETRVFRRWNGARRYIAVCLIDSNGGARYLAPSLTSSRLSPRRRSLSVPFAGAVSSFGFDVASLLGGGRFKGGNERIPANHFEDIARWGV